MLKKKRSNRKNKPEAFSFETSIRNFSRVENQSSESSPKSRFSYLKARSLTFLISAVLSLGVLGAGLKYLEDDARRQMRHGYLTTPRDKESLLNRINPFLLRALPSPTPQLAKEYVYAGSRLLAVEDSNAAFAPPADLAVWRASTGSWWVMGGPGSQQVVQNWGNNGDIPAAGDYDGDGRTDFCVFRPASNDWWILKSSDGNYYSVNFGSAGDKTAQADYDGDGRTDMAVFRSSNATWYILQSSNNQTIQRQFGLSSDAPNPKDFDGDGRADIAVWRNSDTTFYSVNSTNGALSTATFPQSGTSPVSADYDGDGRADYALRIGADWLIKQSSNNQIITLNWQQASDTEVQNDFDGDGKVDVATWRPSNGHWYIRQSSNGQLREQAWGTNGDIPVPAFYRR